MERVRGMQMGVYSAFFLTAGMPMLRRKKRWIAEWYASPASIRQQIRDKLFVRLFRFAYRSVPFYRSLYDGAGIDPESVRGLEDLERLPYVEKEDLKKAKLAELRSRFPRGAFLVHSSTSGSSGAPLILYRSLGALTLYGAQLMGYLDLWGMPGGRKVFFILYNADPTTLLRLPYSTQFAIFNHSHSINPEDGIESISRRILEEQPDAVVAHPSTVEDVADFLDSKSLQCDAAVTFATGGEMLSDRLRGKIAKTFRNGRMLDIYNSVETGMTAFEMPQGNGMYINDYAVILEDGRQHTSEDGRLLVEPVYTNLWNFGTPLIRYRGIEDLLHMEPTDWPVGPGERRITEILGRESEMIVSPSGTRYSVCIVMSAHADLGGVRRFQYVQSDPSLLTFRYVPEDGADRRTIEKEAERQTRTLFGDDLRFCCQPVKILEKRTKSLKIPLLVKD